MSEVPLYSKLRGAWGSDRLWTFRGKLERKHFRKNNSSREFSAGVIGAAPPTRVGGGVPRAS